MYPFIRLLHQNLRARRMPDLGIFDEHVSHHMCMPWDLDFWSELNNGRTLTLYDLGRLPLAHRVGLINVLRAQRWGLTVAGSHVRYRRRITMFQTVTMRSRMIGWDHRFVYLEQGMFRPGSGECTSHALYRSAVTDRNGIVEPSRLLAAMGHPDMAAPVLPDWVQQWIKAEDLRP